MKCLRWCGRFCQIQMLIIDHLGESTQLPRIAPAHDLPLWEAAMATERTGNDSQGDSAAQLEPEFKFDKRIAW